MMTAAEAAAAAAASSSPPPSASFVSLPAGAAAASAADLARPWPPGLGLRAGLVFGLSTTACRAGFALAPAAAFFLWAWAVKIKQERKIAGTLPEWQDMPLTWLAIMGLVCTILGFIVMFLTQNQGYGGLFAS